VVATSLIRGGLLMGAGHIDAKTAKSLILRGCKGAKSDIT